MHGEQEKRVTLERRDRGSSPYARGTGASTPETSSITRIIPVCTGNSAVRGGGFCSYKDHPRMHGEQVHRRLKLPASPGSSPYARGTAFHN